MAKVSEKGPVLEVRKVAIALETSNKTRTFESLLYRLGTSFSSVFVLKVI